MNIVVTQRAVYLQDRNEFRDCLDWRLITFLRTCGFTAVPVPTAIFSSPAEWLAAVRGEGILLSGGNDLAIAGGDSFFERDALEHALLDLAGEQDIPVFGICRGLQIMAAHHGGNIVQITGHVQQNHPVNGHLSRTRVNSFHNYGLAAKALPENILPQAHSEDGGIEAIRLAGLAQAAVMWHPEREESFTPDDLELVGAFFRSGGKCLY